MVVAGMSARMLPSATPASIAAVRVRSPSA